MTLKDSFPWPIGRPLGHGVIRDVTTLASGTAVAQAITVLAAPVLTRLYSPHDLGILALFTAVSAGFVIAASWRYELAIPLAKSEADAANVLGLSCLIVVLMAGLAAMVLTVTGDRLSDALGAPVLEPYLLLIPVAVLVIGSYQPLAWWAARRRHYRHSSGSQILRSAGSASVQIAFGVAKAGPLGLILGSMLGQLVAVGFLATQILRKDGPLIAASLSTKEMLRVGRDQRDFPKFTMPRAVLLSMTDVVPPVLLAIHFNAAVAGAYWLASRVCQMPIVFLGDAVRQVFYERAAAQFNRGEGLLRFLTMSTIGLVLCVIAPFAITIFYAPELYEFAFGEDWFRAGIYTQWLIVPWVFNFICTPSATLVWTFGYQRLLLIFEGLTLVPRLAIIALLSYVGSDATAIAGYSIAGAIFQLCILIFVFLHTWRHQVSVVHAASTELDQHTQLRRELAERSQCGEQLS